MTGQSSAGRFVRRLVASGVLQYAPAMSIPQSAFMARRWSMLDSGGAKHEAFDHHPGGATLLALPSVASASTVGGSYTFDPNPPGPSFGNPALLPDVTLSVSYDSSGTLTISETGHFAIPERLCPAGPIEIDGTSSAGVNDWDLDGSDPAPGLTDSSINGGLAPQVTQTASTLSATYSDPALANQHFAFVTVTPDTTWVPNSTAFQFYFPDARSNRVAARPRSTENAPNRQGQ